MRILISGTSRGLGLAMAQKLGASHQVVGFARGAAKAEVTGFKHISGIDIHEAGFVNKILPELQQAQVLINNIAIAHDGILATQAESAIEEIVHVNLTASIILTKHFVRQRLRLREGGAIVNISSIVGIRGYRGLAVYSATKAGLDGFTRALAREVGAKGITVNSVLPGYMETDLSKSLQSEQKAQIVRRTAMGRLATPGDVIPLIEFLISDQARFITGQSIVVDGGLTV